MKPIIALLAAFMLLVAAQVSAATVNTAACLVNQPPPDPWNPPPPPEPGLCITGVDGVTINGATYNVNFVYDTFTNLNVDGNFPFYPTYGGSGPSDAVDAINLVINTSGTTAEGILPAGKSTSTSYYAVARQPSAGSFVNVSSGYFTYDEMLPMYRHEGGAEHTEGAAPHAVFTAVPIPAAVWLFSSALAGLAWLRRKQIIQI
ncbi:MAG: hypothetical protein GY712_10405 [Oceanicoccus sp.]|uniref:VPLPA-CTERM sorting domain-containing protein n=1 Tax=Oceanicoccus sp. TaxID=2691044 RepID=UPI0026385B89|nr:VPLPA-CTERM sorting domain-containing protein [Oceanicoccus sp.]MCP3908412.1 hypothetical protein [Oceanicoccus sp.]